VDQWLRETISGTFDASALKSGCTYLGGGVMKIMKRSLVAVLIPLSVGIATIDSSIAQTVSDQSAKDAVQSMAKSVCGSCHGVEGRSTDPAIPNLAGQQRTYIEIQLKAFRAQMRRDPDSHAYMWGIAAAWLHDDKVVADIASYYSSQIPAPGKVQDPSAVATGKALFEKSSVDRSVRACVECHGPNAEGAYFFPRLAGQQSEYLARQLKMMRLRLRDSPVMHGVIKDLSDENVTALVAYLQSK
jgi:cytochrome c553